MSARRCCCGGGGPFFPADTRCDDLVTLCAFPTSIMLTWAFHMEMTRPAGGGLAAVRVYTEFEFSCIAQRTIVGGRYLYRNLDITTWTGPIQSEYETDSSGGILRRIDSTIEDADFYEGLGGMFVSCDFLADFDREKGVSADVNTDTPGGGGIEPAARWAYTENGSPGGGEASMFLIPGYSVDVSAPVDCSILGDPFTPADSQTVIQWTAFISPAQSGSVAGFASGAEGNWTINTYSNTLTGTL